MPIWPSDVRDASRPAARRHQPLVMPQMPANAALPAAAPGALKPVPHGAPADPLPT
jgi:hypothetical protein